MTSILFLAMAAILRDKINDLLTANADLEREVARLRYADAARGAAESVETLDKLRKTRDTLNDIVTENDQLKIEVSSNVLWWCLCAIFLCFTPLLTLHLQGWESKVW